MMSGFARQKEDQLEQLVMTLFDDETLCNHFKILINALYSEWNWCREVKSDNFL